MKFMDKMRSIGKEARTIQESLTMYDPHKPGFDPSFSLSSGERMIRRRDDPRWKSMVAECAELMAGVYDGSRPAWHMQEAMTTADFPDLFGDLLYRQLLGNYRAWPVGYPAWMRIHDLRDFRTLNLYNIDGGQGQLPIVTEREPYKEIVFTEGKKTISVVKHGQRYGISFEMLINDDLNAFQNRPQLMATAARRTEEKLATQQLLDVNGPHASFFKAANKNIVTANPVLTIGGLQTAFQVLMEQLDEDSEPILIDAVTLIVGPALAVPAQNILNALEIDVRGQSAGGETDQFLRVRNWMKGKLKLVVNPYMKIVAASETTDNWFLVADPSDATQRPAFHFGFLRGRRDPQLFVKDSNQRQLGGGVVDPTEGDFESDSIDYKLRHIIGASQGDPKMAVSSDGSGS